MVDAQQHLDVSRWRKAERQKLIAERMAISADIRKDWAESIIGHLSGTINFKNKLVSFYWPFRGEPDLRPLMKLVIEQGGNCALPAVIKKAAPLEFWAWKPSDPLERGVWNIPVPKIAIQVTSDIVLAPVVGFDSHGYRLGYGGGFFDRTLAAMSQKTRAIGIGYFISEIKTIFPQPHDLALEMIVTERG